LHEKLIDEGVLAALQAYAWPGNVRELQNVMERMMILSGDKITLDDLPDTVLASSEASSAPSALREFRDRAEREFVLGVLKKNHGNISRAAIELGIARTYLHRRLVALGISKRDWIG
jgi:transcriptional regulator of acetoin/glycerol metabolism